MIYITNGQLSTTSITYQPHDPPYIRTRDNLQDILGLGYCIDVIGFNGNFDFDNLWSHGCKSIDDEFGFADQLFIYDDDLNIIYGADNTPQAGRCLESKCSGNGCEFKLSLIEDDRCAAIKYINDNNVHKQFVKPSNNTI